MNLHDFCSRKYLSYADFKIIHDYQSKQVCDTMNRPVVVLGLLTDSLGW